MEINPSKPAGQPDNPRLVRLRSAILWLTVLAALALVGYPLAFSGYSPSDDEGYVLWSLRRFCLGEPLYTEVFSQYGPVLHLAYRALHAVTGLLPDHELGRWTTLACWLGASLLCGGVARRLAGSWIAGAAGAALTFATLMPLTVEPAHPGGPVVLLVALGAYLGLRAIQEDRPLRLAAGTAVVGAALCLLKINVGGLFLCAVATWLAFNRSGAGPRPNPRLPWLVAALAALLFTGLTRAHAFEPWILILSAVFLGALIPVAFVLESIGAPTHGAASRRLGAWCGLGVFSTVLAATAALGTPPGDTLAAVFLAPLRHSHIYSYAVPWRDGVLTASLVLPALALTLHVFASSRLRVTGLITLRIAAGLCLLWHVRHAADPVGLYRFCFEFGPAFALALIIPLDKNHPKTARESGWIAWLLIWQILQAYPVAGSQIATASFLFPALVAGGMSRGLDEIIARLRHHRALRPLPHLLPFAASLLALGLLARLAWLDYGNGVPLNLPGSRSLRLAEKQARALETIALNLRAHAGQVYSLPGMFSFNLWSERPTPDGHNVTHWFSLLDETQQTRIAHLLAADPDAMIVVDPVHLELLRSIGRSPSGTLHAALLRDFKPHVRLGHYELWNRKDRHVFPLGVFRETSPGQYLLLPASSNQSVAGLRLTQSPPFNRLLLAIQFPASDPVLLAPRSRSELPEAVPMSIGIDWHPSWPKPENTEISLMDAAGTVIQKLTYDSP